ARRHLDVTDDGRDDRVERQPRVVVAGAVQLGFDGAGLPRLQVGGDGGQLELGTSGERPVQVQRGDSAVHGQRWRVGAEVGTAGQFGGDELGVLRDRDLQLEPFDLLDLEA